MTIERPHILGAVLAGGQSLRMQGQHKAQLTLGGQPLLQIAIQRLTSQVDRLIINGSSLQFKQFNHAVVEDGPIYSHQGPLGGLLVSLLYAQKQGYKWLASCPCDAPFFATNYVQVLMQAINHHSPTYPCAVASYDGRVHPTFGLWSTALITPLTELLNNQQRRAMHYWLDQIKSLTVPFDSQTDTSKASFFNINTPEQWLTAEQIFNSQ